VRSIALERDDLGVDWPIPTANIASLGRKLRSKGELLVHLSDPKAIQEAGIPEAELEAVSDDFLEAEVFEKDPRQIQAQAQGVKVSTNVQTPVRTQPAATPEQFRVRPATDLEPIPLDLATQDNLRDNIAEQAESGPGPVAAPVPQQPRHRIMAEDRVLLQQPFSGSAEEDPAEFWRRLETFMIYKSMEDADRLKLTKAMLVGAAQDWIEVMT